MQLVGDKCVVSSRDLAFLAFSFAQMRSQGRHLCTDAITGNMDSDCKVWFLEHYATCFAQLQANATTM